MAKRIPPSIQNMQKFDVNRADQKEAIFEPLYDFQTYDAAGQTSLTFFQNPIGQNGKTLDDTNMEAAGNIPTPRSFLIEAIEVLFFSGANVVEGDADFANAGKGHLSDLYAFIKSGHLKLDVGSKNYLKAAPLGQFPPGERLAGMIAMSDSSTPGATQFSKGEYGAMAGKQFAITPIRLISNQNFSVTMNWGTAVAMPSGLDARIGVRLCGYNYRLSQ